MNKELFWPLLSMFVMTFGLSLYMLYVRIRDARSGKMDYRYFFTYDTGKPSDDVTKTQRHYANLFEVPVLYYVVVILALIYGFNSSLFLSLSWFFVISRIVHMLIHVGPNKLYPRMTAFFSGYLAILCMWILLAWHVVAL